MINELNNTKEKTLLDKINELELPDTPLSTSATFNKHQNEFFIKSCYLFWLGAFISTFLIFAAMIITFIIGLFL